MEKKDLMKLFNVEGLITPRSISSESKAEVMKKTPAEMGLDVRALMDEINLHIIQQNIDGVIKSLNAANVRIACMLEVATRMKTTIDKNKKK